jgi:DNA helicase II / ATP-dependent DNA helicase PcrA
VNDTDAWETEADRVTLMTLHASKGLEFPVVYLTAVEEGLLPHERSREHPDQIEEERRLMFVGITRAQQELQISMARYRDFRGQRKLTIPSSFLMELPRAEMAVEFPETAAQSADLSHEEADHIHVAPDETWHDAQGGSDAFDDHCPSDGRPMATSPLRVPPILSLTTAAALANGGRTAPPPAPDAFRQGMVVLHTTFGLGQIAALSGTGAARKATVDFLPPIGRKRILLADGELQPVGEVSDNS